MPRRQFEGGRRQAWREDQATREEARQRPADSGRPAPPPPRTQSPVEPQQAPPPAPPRRRFQPSGSEGADALLKRLGVAEAGFAEQYQAVQE
ncbi:MAG TPA: hypothetical protein VGR16_10100, partial [Thermomicrobiales bacterium]|nr:hypothetical protein [Thermomicrobiales bacterium]